MKIIEISLLQWQKRFGTERACEKISQWYFSRRINKVSPGIPERVLLPF